jgi:hypothetical protein
LVGHLRVAGGLEKAGCAQLVDRLHREPLISWVESCI